MNTPNQAENNNSGTLSTSNEDVHLCPDCKSSAPKKDSFWYCQTCNEYLAVDEASLQYLAKITSSFKILAPAVNLRLFSDDQRQILQQKLLKSSTVKSFTMILSADADISTIDWLKQFYMVHSNLEDITLTWECPADLLDRSGLRSCSNLTELTLHYLAITKGSGNMLVETIRSLKKLHTLCFTDLNVHPDEVQMLSEVLKSNDSIKDLTILDYAESWIILNGVLAENKSIEKLTLEITTTSVRTIDDNIMMAVFGGLKDNTTLKELDITSTFAFNQSAIKQFAECLRSNQSITTLNIEADINNEALEDLSDALSNNKTIQTLNLGNNEFTSVPATLFRMSSLKTLNLADVNRAISNGFTKEFIEAFRSNTSLTSLNMPVKGNDGCRALADGLKGNATLYSLHAMIHDADEDAIRHFGSALETHPTIEFLLTGDYGCTYSIFAPICDVIRKNKVLEAIAVIGSYNDSFNINWFLDALKENNTLQSFGAYVNDDRYVIMDDEEKVASLFEVNYALTHLDLFCAPAQQYLERNRKYLQEMYENTMVVIHSIARDPLMRSLLPSEIWINVFAHLRYPGFKTFGPIALRIFGKYK